jgi:OFA family oxalate/formate antiporter-like MFS transporter
MQQSDRSSAGAAWGWVVMFAGLGANLVLGSLYAWGVVAKWLKVNMNWSDAATAYPFAAATIAFAITMIFAGRMQDRLGPRLVATIGGLVFGVGLAATGLAYWLTGGTGPVVIYMVITYGIIGGIGIGLGYSSTTPPAVKWFPPSRKGIVTGVVVAGVGLSAVYAAPLLEALIAAVGLEATFGIVGGSAMLIICAMAQLLRNPPAGYVPAAAVAVTASPAAPRRADVPWHAMLCTRQFYQLWVTMVLAGFAGLMLIQHVAKIGQAQAGLKWGFSCVAILALFNTGGRLVSGLLSDRIGRPATMVIAFVIQAGNMLAFGYYNTPELILFGSALAGLCYGTIFTLMPSVTADYYGLKNLGVNYGLLFTAFGVAGTLGGVLGGWLKDTTGSWQTGYYVAAAMLAAGAILAALTRAPKLPPTADAGITPPPLLQKTA